jgi:hypothetical protein
LSCMTPGEPASPDFRRNSYSAYALIILSICVITSWSLSTMS